MFTDTTPYLRPLSQLYRHNCCRRFFEKVKPHVFIQRHFGTSEATSQGLPAAQTAIHEQPLNGPKPYTNRLSNVKPFSNFLTDNFRRQHDYLRISVTEKCNLRCLYCMPEEGVPLSPPAHLLTSSEIFYLSSLFVNQGVTKIRLTGGEPTVRPDIVPLMQRIGSLRSAGLRELCLTTNGVALHRKLDRMVEAGLTGVNLSLDTLDPFQFQIMTRRKGFEAVMKSIDKILGLNQKREVIKLKINCVVMRGINDREIFSFVDLTREQRLEVRFIEYMPFDGNKWSKGKMLGYSEMLNMIRSKYPSLQKIQDHFNDTSKTYRVPGFAGKIGFITSMTHNFCGTCNRLRITSDGNLKVCLFGNTEVSLRDILRTGNGGMPIDDGSFRRIQDEALRQAHDITPEDAALSQLGCLEHNLLTVIGQAVKRKKEKHAGMGQLENMKNRPMILIDEYRVPLRRLTETGFKIKPRNMALYQRQAMFSHEESISSLRLFSTASRRLGGAASKLTHISPEGAPYMVPVTDKPATSRLATAEGTVIFGNELPLQQIKSHSTKKGDVLALARVAGIMAAKRTPDLIPLCHPIVLTGVELEAELLTAKGDEETLRHGGVQIRATVTCHGPTGVEMEALTAVMGAALTVIDMIKGIDRHVRVASIYMTRKEGGRSGNWVRKEE